MRPHAISCTLSASLVLLGYAPAKAQEVALYKDKTAAVEARVDDLLPRLTLDEKLSLLGGDNQFYIRAIPRLGIPEVRMADGPLGVRNWGFSTAYPATVGLAAAWDYNLAKAYGASVGNDARARGVGIMLGPAVNIARVPQNGRNFEYLSEDPFLAGAVAAQIVTGLQGQGVVATVKHFAANNQETNRGTIDAVVGERALREIYLPAFQAAVEQGHAWAVMCAYNKLNGTYCSADSWLNNTVLKGDWGFKGVLMSDWGAAHDTLAVANGGLDLEMPSGHYMNPAALKPLIDSGQVTMATIDDKIRRILRLEIANGFFDRPQEIDSIPKDDPHSSAVALQIARESIVLLKNEHNALPLASKRLKTIVVLGPNANNLPAGGGSAHVGPFHSVSVAEGLRLVAGRKVRVDVIPGPGPELLASLAASSRYTSPLKLEFLAGDWRNTKVIATLSDPRIDHDWTGAPAPGVELEGYRARWTGSIRPPATGRYIFIVQNHGNINVRLDDKQIIASWFNTGESLYAVVSLEAGRTYPIQVEARHDLPDSGAVRFGWGAAPPLLTDAEASRVRSADAVVLCVGFNLMLEGEGADRTYGLPDDQPELIRKVAALNPRTVVVLNSGGEVGTADWVGSVPALLEAWYPGQEGGKAVAEVILGAVNPSGRLPVTFGKRIEDSAAYGNYPGSEGKVNYAEGILVGYRWFDAKGIAPLFPFGYGLNYTTFHYDRLHVDPTSDGQWTISFELTNNGTRLGDEVSEIYVSPPAPSRVLRPVRELKGFVRTTLAPDETRQISIAVDRKAFSYYDEGKHDWEIEPGSYTVAVGSSSRNLAVTSAVTVP
ncbi:MAG TPA: glycoside hydrolase family 3 C-terminal domain-containing protein [Opitutaceae bacterium]|jgi:beta-glucosidase